MIKVVKFEDVESYMELSNKNPWSVLNADFAATGDPSEYDAARALITLIQASARKYNDPVIFAGIDAFMYMQRNDQIVGFLTKAMDFIHVGDLSTGRQVIVVTRQIEECSSCGNRELPVRNICQKCGSAYHHSIGNATLPVYTSSRSNNRELNNRLIIYSKKENAADSIRIDHSRYSVNTY
jgi:ribosomal protein L32